MRAQLAADLVTQRSLGEQLQDEIKTLKLNQKFLHGGAGSSGAVSSEKMDLMRMVNQMLAENNKLKEEKVLLEADIGKLRREAIHTKVNSTVGDREVTLAASDQINPDVMTTKI